MLKISCGLLGSWLEEQDDYFVEGIDSVSYSYI